MWNKDCSKILEVKKKNIVQDSYSLMGEFNYLSEHLVFFFFFLNIGEMVPLGRLLNRPLQAGLWAQKSLYSFEIWGVAQLWSISGGVLLLFCYFTVIQAYSICTKESLLEKACCYGRKNILQLFFLFFFFVSFFTFNWVAFCRIKWIKIEEPLMVGLFCLFFLSFLSLLFFSF